MTRTAHEPPTDRERDILRWLIGSGQLDGLDRGVLFDFYEQRGTATTGLRTVSRRGAAGRMFWAMHDKGYFEHADGGYRVTAAGKAAANG